MSAYFLGAKKGGVLSLLLLLIGLLLSACGDPTATTVSTTATTTSATTTAAVTTSATSVVTAATTTATTTSATTTAATSGNLETIKVAHTPSVLFAPLYVAIENGYFSEQGLKVELTQVQAGQDAIALAGQGQLDVVVAGLSAATFNAVNRGIDIKVVASMAYQPKTGTPTALMLRKSLTDSIKTLPDLKGKKVAILGGNGTTGAYYMSLKLKEANLTLKDIQIVNLSAADQVTAIASGAIDATLASAPFTTRMIQDGTAVVFGGPITPGISGTAIMYGPNFAKKTDQAQKFMIAMLKGARAVQGDAYKSAKNLDIYANYTKQPLDTVKALDPYDFSPDLAIDKTTLTNMQQIFIESGALSLDKPLAVEKLIDESFTKAAVEKLGPYKG